MATRVQAHPQYGIARLCHRQHNRAVRLRAAMRLYIRKITIKQFLGALDCQRFYDVGWTAALIISLARIALSIFVCEYRTLGFQYRTRHYVFRSDQFNLKLLPVDLLR